MAAYLTPHARAQPLPEPGCRHPAPGSTRSTRSALKSDMTVTRASAYGSSCVWLTALPRLSLMCSSQRRRAA